MFMASIYVWMGGVFWWLMVRSEGLGVAWLIRRSIQFGHCRFWKDEAQVNLLMIRSVVGRYAVEVAVPMIARRVLSSTHRHSATLGITRRTTPSSLVSQCCNW